MNKTLLALALAIASMPLAFGQPQQPAANPPASTTATKTKKAKKPHVKKSHVKKPKTKGTSGTSSGTSK